MTALDSTRVERDTDRRYRWRDINWPFALVVIYFVTAFALGLWCGACWML